MITVRCDDIFFDTDVEAVKRIWKLIHQFPFPHIIAVTPKGRGDPLHHMKPLKRGNEWMLKATGKDCVSDNQALVDTINHYKTMGAKIAIHGLYHIDYRKLSLPEQRHHLSTAKSILESLFGKISYFVPPFNKANDDTIKVCKELGLLLLSSYYEADIRIIATISRSLTNIAKKTVKVGNFAYHPYWLQGEWKAYSHIINGKKFNISEAKWNLDDALIRLRQFLEKIQIEKSSIVKEKAKEGWVQARFIERGASNIYKNLVDHEIRRWFYGEVKNKGITSVLDVGYPPGHFEERRSYIPPGWSVEFTKVRDEEKDKYFTIWIIKRQMG